MYDLSLRAKWDSGMLARVCLRRRPRGARRHRANGNRFSAADKAVTAPGMTGDTNRTVVYVDRSISITYYRVGNVGPVSSRDFLDLRGLNQLEGNLGYLLAFRSVDWDSQPVVPG